MIAGFLTGFFVACHETNACYVEVLIYLRPRLIMVTTYIHTTPFSVAHAAITSIITIITTR